jgi:peptide/nickel transport system substrate-binding protein
MSDETQRTDRMGILRPISRRRFLGGATVAALSAGGVGPLLAACSSPSSGGSQSSGTPSKGGNLTFARTADPGTLDPSPSEDNEAIWTNLNMYDCLYTVTPDGHGSMPWLAVGHDLSSDQLTWTFHLRPGVKFSDGKPLTAQDVRFTLERAAKGVNGYILSSVDGVDAPDSSTVRIHTKHPWGPLLGDVSLYATAILPSDLNGMSDADFFKQPTGTGPFMLAHWTKGQELKLVRNPHYWQQGKPHLDSVTFTVVPDDNTRVLQLKGGQADIVEFPPFSAVATLQQTPGIKVDLFPSTWVSYIKMNEKRPPFADVHVRRAISYAIDRASIIRAVLFGHGQPAASFFSPGWAFYNASTTQLWYNVDQAKQELSMSKYPNGFSATYAVIAGDTENESIAQIVQSNLKAIGIDLSIRSYDVSALDALTNKGQYDMTPDYYTLDIGDPDENVPWAVDPIYGGSNSLDTWYSNRQVLQWTYQSESTIDTAERGAIYAKMQETVAMESPFVELYYQPYVYAQKSSIGGFSIPPTGNYHLENVWLTS